jgi:hypothetical protein
VNSGTKWRRKSATQCENFFFGSIRIDGNEYAHDVVIDRNEIRKRKKRLPSNSGMTSVIRRFLLRKTSPGNAVSW